MIVLSDYKFFQYMEKNKDTAPGILSTSLSVINTKNTTALYNNTANYMQMLSKQNFHHMHHDIAFYQKICDSKDQLLNNILIACGRKMIEQKSSTAIYMWTHDQDINAIATFFYGLYVIHKANIKDYVNISIEPSQKKDIDDFFIATRFESRPYCHACRS